MADQPQKSALRWLAGLAVLTGLSVAGAIGVVLVQESSTAVRFEPRPFFDDLETRINEAEKIVYTIGQGLSGTGTITLNRLSADRWTVAERAGYPAKQEKMRKLIVGLVELEKFEPRTANPEWHRELGLVRPEDLGKAARIEVFDEEGEALVRLLAGNVVEDTQDPQGRGLIYVREDGAAQTWLARGRLPLFKQPVQWLALDVFSLKREEVRRAVLWAESDTPAVIERDSPQEKDFHLANPPEGRAGRGAAIINGSATALVGLTPEDAVPADELDFTDGPVARFETFGGLRIDVKMTGGGDQLWALFSASADPALLGPEGDISDAEKRAVEINARTDGWAFRLDQPTAVKLGQKMDSLTRPAGAPQRGAAPQTPAGPRMGPGPRP